MLVGGLLPAGMPRLESREGPFVWEGTEGWWVPIPEGWTVTDLPEPGLWLHAERGDGVLVELWGFPATATLAPRERSDCEVVFSNDGDHRRVPALGLSRTATCVSIQPEGPVTREWFADVGAWQVHAELTTPAGLGVSALRELPLLGTLRAP